MSQDQQQAIGEKVENKLELIILSYVIKDTKFLQQIIDFGAQPDWFTNESLRIFYEMALNHYRKHRVIITKNYWVQKVAVLTQNDASVRGFYESFYDNLRSFQYTDEDLPEHLERWRVDVGRFKISQSFKKYAGEVESYGYDKAVESLIRNVTSAKGSDQKDKQYYISDLETDGCELVLEDAIKRKENPEGSRGFLTGYREIDVRFNGFDRGKVAMIMGLTSSGKTTFARNIAWNIKCRYHVRVLCISCEESRLDYLKKVACTELKLSLKQFLRGELSDEDMQRLRDWGQKFRRLREEMEADNTTESWFRVLEVPARKYNLYEIDQIIEKEFPDGVDVVVLDQLSLVAPIVSRGEQIFAEMGDSSKVFREMAKRRNFAGIMLAQAGRSAVKKNKNERWVELNIEDVEGSNQPMQDMDAAFGIRRDLQLSNITHIKLLKQREGEVNIEFRLLFDADRCRFDDIEEGTNFESDGFTPKPPKKNSLRAQAEAVLPTAPPVMNSVSGVAFIKAADGQMIPVVQTVAHPVPLFPSAPKPNLPDYRPLDISVIPDALGLNDGLI
jgi:replicative DNA helicase